MTATNHVVTGIFIAAAIHNPWLALPLAFLSHFALDSLPHFGLPEIPLNSNRFKQLLGVDTLVAFLCLVFLLLFGSAHVWQLMLGGILAASPDLMWLPDFIASIKGQTQPIYGPIRRFHSKIQWYQKPDGAYIEAAWFVIFFIITFGFAI